MFATRKQVRETGYYVFDRRFLEYTRRDVRIRAVDERAFSIVRRCADNIDPLTMLHRPPPPPLIALDCLYGVIIVGNNCDTFAHIVKIFVTMINCIFYKRLKRMLVVIVLSANNN